MLTLAEPDPAAFVIDCTWNMGDGAEVYLERITQLVHTIRKAGSLTPIVFVAQSQMRTDAHPTELTRRQEAAVLSFAERGVPDFGGTLAMFGLSLGAMGWIRRQTRNR